MSERHDRILELFDKTGAYLRGHFRLTSGLHSPAYLQCAQVLQYPVHAERLGRDLAGALKELLVQEYGSSKLDVVVSPALGGLIIGHETARALGVRHIFAERDAERRMALRRGFQVQPGEIAVVVEDVITTGGSSLEVIHLLRERGVQVLAAGAVIDRSGGQAELGVPRAALATLKVVTYEESSCPLCRQGYPLVKPGSRPV